MTRLLLATGLSCALFTGVRSEAADFKAGAAAHEITPPVGTPLAGYYHERPSERVLDPLYAKALVLELGSTKVALVSLDLISTPRHLVERSRQEIEKATGIPGQNVMLSATHAHTGPVLLGRGERDDVFGGRNPLTRAYNAELPGKIARAVAEANHRLVGASVRAGAGNEPSIAFNRRFHMKDGTVGWNPGVLNPNIVRPAGPIDPELALVLFEQPAANARGAPLAAYVNYAVHLDNVGGTGISADMPSVIAEAMSSGRGRDLITIYTSGCCGDINHIDVTNGERQQGPGMAHRMGTILAAELFKLWPKLPPASTGSLAVRTTMVKLPLAPVSESQIEKARGVAARADAAAGQPTNSLPPFMEMVDAYKTLDVVEQDGKPIEVEVQAIALGTDVAWVSLPGEIFVELGMAIKKRSPFPRTIIAELANGTIGYIPTRRAYPHGNYEVVSARVAEGSGEMLVNAAVALLEALHKNSASK